MKDWKFTEQDLLSIIRPYDIIHLSSPQTIEGTVSNSSPNSTEEPLTGDIIQPQHIILKPENLTNQKIDIRKNPYPKIKR